MVRTLRLAHTSDVHLADGDSAAGNRDAFVRVVDAVLDASVDMFLIAGDLFDHNRVVGESIDLVYEQLSRVSCPTILIPGNHDCFDETSVLRRVDFSRAGTHVHLLSAERGDYRVFPDLKATVWGQGIVDHAPENKPLATFPERTPGHWHIGMAHGLYVYDRDEYRSSRITPDEIAATGFDYLALGHVHAYAEYRHGSTLACYPGAPLPYAGTDQVGSLLIIDLEPGVPARASRLRIEEAVA